MARGCCVRKLGKQKITHRKTVTECVIDRLNAKGWADVSYQRKPEVRPAFYLWKGRETNSYQLNANGTAYRLSKTETATPPTSQTEQADSKIAKSFAKEKRKDS